jgi:hypothetical protein
MKITKMHTGTMAVLFLFSLILVFGCNQKKTQEKMTEKVLEKATGKDVDVNIDKGKIQIADKDSRTEIVETKSWPSNLSDEVPKCSAGKIIRVVRTQEKADTWTVNIYLSDISIKDIRSYESDLKSKGWQTSFMQMGDKGGYLNGQKGTLGISFVLNQEKQDGMLGIFSRP